MQGKRRDRVLSTRSTPARAHGTCAGTPTSRAGIRPRTSVCCRAARPSRCVRPRHVAHHVCVVVHPSHSLSVCCARELTLRVLPVVQLTYGHTLWIVGTPWWGVPGQERRDAGRQSLDGRPQADRPDPPPGPRLRPTPAAPAQTPMRRTASPRHETQCGAECGGGGAAIGVPPGSPDGVPRGGAQPVRGDVRRGHDYLARRLAHLRHTRRWWQPGRGDGGVDRAGRAELSRDPGAVHGGGGGGRAGAAVRGVL